VANVGDCASTCASFEWETPERFNFGRDVVEEPSANSGKPGGIPTIRGL
jgi:hypothetical protein